MKRLDLLVALSAIVFCGCEAQRQPPPSVTVLPPVTAPESYSTPTGLSNLISSADHILITNRFANSDPRLVGFSLVISGSDARQIVRAVSTSRTYPNWTPSNSIWDWELQFYSLTNRLAAVDFQGSTFMFGNIEWCDQTGLLDKLEDELLHRAGFL
jgi:hypothetical protein